MTATATDFDAFYQAHYGETVAMTYGFTADLAESQDIAQEAFSRAWQRWKVISRYEQPVSWVRRVATNLAHSRWRKVRVASSYLTRQRAEDLPDLSPDHVDMVAALRTLPIAQRKAVVLHYLADLPVGEVASELGVPEGTVKSWLHRGRNSLAAELGDEVARSVGTPPSADLRLRSERGKRVRRSIAATAAAFAAVLMLVAGLRLLGPAGAQPPLPPADPSTSPTPTPSTPAPPKPAPAIPAPADISQCQAQKLPLPPGQGPASYLSGGDPTGRYLVGSSSDTDILVWEYGKLIASPVLDGIDDSMIVDINSKGFGVARSTDAEGGDIPWLYRDNKFTRLRGQYASPSAINEANVIVGTMNMRPVIWRTPESEPEFLPIPEGVRPYGSALAITEEGLVSLHFPGIERERQRDRMFVWYPDDGTTIELILPPQVPATADIATARVAGEWASSAYWRDGRWASVRWNLRTGKSEIVEGFDIGSVVTEHGWMGGTWQKRAALRTAGGKVIQLPAIKGASLEDPWDSVNALSDDGRSAGGQMHLETGSYDETVAVRWTCE